MCSCRRQESTAGKRAKAEEQSATTTVELANASTDHTAVAVPIEARLEPTETSAIGTAHAEASNGVKASEPSTSCEEIPTPNPSHF